MMLILFRRNGVFEWLFDKFTDKVTPLGTSSTGPVNTKFGGNDRPINVYIEHIHITKSNEYIIRSNPT